MELKSSQKKQGERRQNRQQSRWTTTQTLSLGDEQELFVLDTSGSEPPRRLSGVFVGLCSAANQNVSLCFCTSYITITWELSFIPSQMSYCVTLWLHSHPIKIPTC